MTLIQSPLDLNAYLGAEAEKIDTALHRALAMVAPDLPEALRAPVAHGVLTGGKRLRPVLCVAAYEALGSVANDAVYDLAVSLELIHAYSLMHDDLPCMDDAELRRGDPTTHRVHGEANTILGGLALIPAAGLRAWSAAQALGLPDEAARDIVSVLMQAAGASGMVGGQVLDLEGEESVLDEAALTDLHRRKTGALLTASLELGAIAAEADSGRRGALREYGRAIGLAFQVADDILDATATADELGKNPSDAALGKSTYVAIHGLPEAKRRAEVLVAEALDALASAQIESEVLRGLAAYVVERKK